jgi:hypothetical protein
MRRNLLFIFIGAALLCSASQSAEEFSFAVLGDFQASECSDNEYIIRQVAATAQAHADFFVCIGDLIAGYSDAACFASNGSCSQAGGIGNVRDILTPLMRTPQGGLLSSLFLVIGNHDDGWGDNWYPDPCGNGICDVMAPVYINHGDTLRAAGFYSHALNHGDICSLNRNTSGHGNDYFYSFAYRNCYFIFLYLNSDYVGMLQCNNLPSRYTTCEDYCADSALFLDPERNRNCYDVFQYDWFLNELRVAEKYRHIFVFAHAPLVTSSNNHEAIIGAASYRNALERAGVDIYFNGHNHAYERTYPVRDDRRDSTSVIYLTVGPGGAKTDDISGAWFTAASYKNWTGENESQEKQSGYVLITVKEDGTVHGERRGIDNLLQDSFSLVRRDADGAVRRSINPVMFTQGTVDRCRIINNHILLSHLGKPFTHVEIAGINGRVIRSRHFDGYNECGGRAVLPNDLNPGFYLVILRNNQRICGVSNLVIPQ